MRRVGLFLSRLLLGLWVALLCTFAFLLLFNAPTAPDTPFSVWRSLLTLTPFTYRLGFLTAQKQNSSSNVRQIFKIVL